MARRRRNLEGKGGTYLEKENIWPTEEQKWDRKRRKIFEEGKYLFCGGINEHIIQITKKVQKNHMGCVALAGLESADLAVSPPGQRSPPSRATPVGSLGPP